MTEQLEDQAGSRSVYGCKDHLFTLTMLTEMCNEFNIPLWVATLDFKKAFDSISHASIWESLDANGVEHIYINVLSRLYHGQCAKVTGEVDSREFAIKKGEKQGGPISPMLFNAVLEQVVRQAKKR